MNIPKISYTDEKRSNSGCSLTLEGLTGTEVDLIKGLLQGRLWASVGENGRLEHRWNLADLPEQTLDDEMLPFWRKVTTEEVSSQIIELGLTEDFELHRGHMSPNYIISHLCGYHYTKERYIDEAARLLDYGFIEMRSRRGNDGKYWQHWVLLGDWSAQGLLKKFIDDIERGNDFKSKSDQIVSFLCKHCSFGTLDLSWQRAAMTISD